MSSSCEPNEFVLALIGDSSDKAAPVSGEHAEEAGAAPIETTGGACHVYFSILSLRAARRTTTFTCPFITNMKPAHNPQPTVVQLDLTRAPPPLAAPSTLTAAERAAFNEIVSQCDPRQFAKSDVPLLVSYVQTTLAVRKLVVTVNKKPSTGAFTSLDRMTRLQLAIATKLRLTPHSRVDRKTAERLATKQRGTSYYDRMPVADDDD